MNTIYKTENDEEIRKNWFKGHVVEARTEGSEQHDFLWRKPGTGIFLVAYQLRDGYLTVTGDIGCAVFRWNGGIDLEFFSNVGLSYFEEKCQASDCGRNFQEWSEAKALDRVEELFGEDAEDCGYNMDHKEDALGACEGQESWHSFLENFGHDAFGEDWYEFGGIGMKVSMHCEGMLIGLKMAHEWLQAQNK